jgi:hypothetical protein
MAKSYKLSFVFFFLVLSEEVRRLLGRGLSEGGLLLGSSDGGRLFYKRQ